MAISGNQLKAARALAEFDQQVLADQARVGVNTIRNMEAAGGANIRARTDTLDAVVSALEAAGVEFTNGGQPGVRLKKPASGAAIESVTEKIEALEERVADIPVLDGPSPEAAINVMDKALAENDLTKLKNRWARLKRDGTQ